MSPKITVIGLGPGSPDSLSLGAVRALQRLRESGRPVMARTTRHPTIDWLISERTLDLTGSYDGLYDRAASFDALYHEIAADLVARASASGEIGYIVPGHPRVGEKTVELLDAASSAGECDVEIVAGQSYLDAVLAQESLSTTPLRVLDALDLIRKPAHFDPEPEPLDPSVTTVVYQVYDRAIASELKLALLEMYPPDAAVVVVSAAGVPGQAARAQRTSAQLDHAGVEFGHLTTVVLPPLLRREEFVGFQGLQAIMAKLRDPNGGCPWDREQTRHSLRRYLIEEAYEVLDASESGDDAAYAEELGDLLLQVVFHAQLAREADRFGMRDILRAVTSKLVRRHPHVFGDVVAEDSAQVLANWAEIKRAEKGYEDRKSILDGVPRPMPALMRAQEISRRAAKAGFEWDSIDGVFAKLDEEIGEMRRAIASDDFVEVERELGDILFTAVNLARFRGFDAEDALGRMIDRFSSRFRRIEAHAESVGKPLADLSQAEMEQVWQLAKREQ